MELRIKQLLAHVINQLAANATGWKCVPVMQEADLLRGTEARPLPPLSSL